MGESGARYQMANIHKAMRQAQSKYIYIEPVMQVGQAVMLKNHGRTGKLDSYYKPYYRIIEQLSPAMFRVKNVQQTVQSKMCTQKISKSLISMTGMCRDSRIRVEKVSGKQP